MAKKAKDSSEEIIGNVIGMEHMLYAVMRIASVRTGNQIVFSPEETAGIYLGEKGIFTPTKRTAAIEELLKNTGIRCHFVKDIILDMCVKYHCQKILCCFTA